LTVRVLSAGKAPSEKEWKEHFEDFNERKHFLKNEIKKIKKKINLDEQDKNGHEASLDEEEFLYLYQSTLDREACCTICTEYCAQPIRNECGHHVCMQCMKDWMAS
jgi:hypothetical protein